MDIKEAKNVLKELKENKYGELLNCYDQGEEAEKAIEVLLNELDKKEKIINEMGRSIYLLDAMSEYGNTTQEVIDYFTKKAEGK